MQRLAIVLNPDSGSSETSKKEITKLFDSKRFSLQYFDITQGLGKLQKSIHVYDPESVIAVGGDGTVNAVATIVTQLNLPMGVIPTGTLNHFAKDAGLPSSLQEAASDIMEGAITKIDYATVNDRVFVNNCNFGGYPEMVMKRDELNLPSKPLAGLVAAIQVWSRHKKQLFEIVIDGEPQKVLAGSLFIGNNSYQLSGVKFTAREYLDRGRLQFVIVKTGRLQNLAAIIMSFIVSGSHQKAEVREAKQITIISSRNFYDVAVDGEVARLSMPLNIVIHPKALRLIMGHTKK